MSYGRGEDLERVKGNRTFVFSLEVSKNCSVFKGRSDIFGVFGPLRSFRISRCQNGGCKPHGRSKTRFVPSMEIR